MSMPLPRLYLDRQDRWPAFATLGVPQDKVPLSFRDEELVNPPHRFDRPLNHPVSGRTDDPAVCAFLATSRYV
eukprot:scaffold6717_cov160-Amphora_coffeaeformis.AAC.4